MGPKNLIVMRKKTQELGITGHTNFTECEGF